jgi:hypothetical protein
MAHPLPTFFRALSISRLKTLMIVRLIGGRGAVRHMQGRWTVEERVAA